jgi:hypothetical protein
LVRKGNRQNARGGMQQPAVGRGDLRNLLRQIGHIQGAGDTVQHRHANQKQRGREQIDRDVVKSRLYACASGPMQQQSVGSGQQYLEEHEEVEQIAGEKSAIQAHQLNLQQRVKVHAGTVPARDGKQHAAQTDDAAQHQHQRRQAVDREHDAEGDVPVRGQVDTDRGRGSERIDTLEQDDRDEQAQPIRYHIDERFPAPPLAQQQHQNRSKQGAAGSVRR